MIMLLATDLDGTFLGGKSVYKQQLYSLIRENRDMRVVFVTGRGLESVIPLLNDPIIPNPDFIICDVGATIVNGHTLEPVDPLQSAIEKKWPGHLKILEALKDIEGIKYKEVPQERRCSFYTKNESLVGQVKLKAKSIGCDVIYSANKFLDVLPMNTNKGNSLTALVNHLGIDHKDVMVAGDTLNDLSMYECGFKGVIVGEAEPKLVEATENYPDIFCATYAGAGGILMGMEHFGFISEFTRTESGNLHPHAIADVPQLIVMYHRFPYEKKEIAGKIERVPPKSPNGILPTLQSLFLHGRSGVWIAWEEVENEGELLRNIYFDKEKYPNLMASRIGLTRDQVDIFYRSFGKEAFWPTLFAFIDRVKFNHHHWDHFVNINRLFAVKAMEQADYGAIIWIHDYNLWLVPGILRQMRPDLTIGFFHHTAFPTANIFNVLPWRREIIGSLLQCDYVGFHIPRYVENFTDVVKSLFPVKIIETVKCAPRFLTYGAAIGVDTMTTEIDTGHRKVKLGANPVGINIGYIREILGNVDVQQDISQMKDQNKGKKILLSVERLDYVKGPLEKVLAFEQFLNDYPEFHGKVELINICTPPSSGMNVYDKVQHDLEQTIGRINGKYSNMDWTPIRLFFRSLPFEEVIKYYAIADIAWITPLRDGLNLVAKEYVAVKGLTDKKGVLVLSEFAGAAAELPYAILTNPYDPQSLKDSLIQALLLSDEEKQMRIQRLFEHISHFDINHWAKTFLQNLSPHKPDVLSVGKLDNGELVLLN
jgi:glucosylglycerol-phosphate synthase